MYFVPIRNCHIWHGRLQHSSDLMRGWISAGILCPCGPKLVKGRSKCGDCLLATTVRTHNFSNNRCPRPRSMWQPRSLKNSFDCKSGAPPGTTYTRSTPLTPAIPTGSIASSVSSLPKRNAMASQAGSVAYSGPIFV